MPFKETAVFTIAAAKSIRPPGAQWPALKAWLKYRAGTREPKQLRLRRRLFGLFIRVQPNAGEIEYVPLRFQKVVRRAGILPPPPHLRALSFGHLSIDRVI